MIDLTRTKTKEEKGQIGEDTISCLIQLLAEENENVIALFNGVYLEYFSVYGNRTVEIDHVILTRTKIILCETKNISFSEANYKKPQWKMKNGDSVSNPIIQNHVHKSVFCSNYGIARENVITLELLLKEKDMPLRTDFPNDYVLGYDNLIEGLKTVLSEEGNIQDFSDALDLLEKVEKAKEVLKVKHLNNLEQIEWFEEKTRTRDNTYRFKRTDIVKCRKCDGNLVFRKCPGKNGMHEFPALGCTHFPDENCREYIVPEKNGGDGFGVVSAISIEERMHWGEEQHVPTILEHINKVRDEWIYCKREAELDKRTIQILEDSNKSLRNDAKQMSSLNNEIKMDNKVLKEKLASFHHLIGRLYVRR